MISQLHSLSSVVLFEQVQALHLVALLLTTLDFLHYREPLDYHGLPLMIWFRCLALIAYLLLDRWFIGPMRLLNLVAGIEDLHFIRLLNLSL